MQNMNKMVLNIEWSAELVVKNKIKLQPLCKISWVNFALAIIG